MAIYRLYRGVDARDVAQAHSLALSSRLTGFQVFNISAATPFSPEDTRELLSNGRQSFFDTFHGRKRRLLFGAGQCQIPSTVFMRSAGPRGF